MEKELKKFELNNEVLEDFDTLMSKHLDQIEELTISEIDAKSKLLNIVGLCVNIKTIIIEGDERTNVNNIIANIFKPELIQNLILNGVKVPSTFSFKKLTSLRMLSLNNIRSCSAKIAINQIVNPEKIEALNFDNVDFAKASLDCIEKFKNLKYLNLIRVKNCKLSNLDFLSEMKNLERINIEKNIVSFAEINNIIKCKFNKQIQLDLPTLKEDSFTNSLEITEDGRVLVTINSNKLKDLTQNLNLFKVTDIIIIISNNKFEIKDYIYTLKRVKGKVSVAIKDISCLSVKDAKNLKDTLKLKHVNIIDFDGVLQYEKNKYCYTIEDYIKIRAEIDSLLDEINDNDEELLKFLKIYRIIGENIIYDELVQDELEDYSKKHEAKSSNLQNGILEKKCIDSGFSEILKNILACVGIESKIIRGKFLGNEKECVWNQVKILGKWYNVDLASDSKRMNNSKNKKSKPIYCLIGDKTFLKTHIPLTPNKEFLPETLERRVLSNYFKREIDIKEYIDNIIEKLKRIFKYNRPKLLAEGKGRHEK